MSTAPRFYRNEEHGEGRTRNWDREMRVPVVGGAAMRGHLRASRARGQRAKRNTRCGLFQDSFRATRETGLVPDGFLNQARQGPDIKKGGGKKTGKRKN